MTLQAKIKLTEYLKQLVIDTLTSVDKFGEAMKDAQDTGDQKLVEMMTDLQKLVEEFKKYEWDIRYLKLVKLYIEKKYKEIGKWIGKAVDEIRKRADADEDKKTLKSLEGIGFTYLGEFENKIKFYQLLYNKVTKSIKEENDWKTYFAEIKESQKGGEIETKIEVEFDDIERAKKIATEAFKLRWSSNWQEWENFLLEEEDSMEKEFESFGAHKKLAVELEKAIRQREEFIDEKAKALKDKAGKVKEYAAESEKREGEALVALIQEGKKIEKISDDLREVYTEKLHLLDNEKKLNAWLDRVGARATNAQLKQYSDAISEIYERQDQLTKKLGELAKESGKVDLDTAEKNYTKAA